MSTKKHSHSRSRSRSKKRDEDSAAAAAAAVGAITPATIAAAKKTFDAVPGAATASDAKTQKILTVQVSTIANKAKRQLLWQHQKRAKNKVRKELSLKRKKLAEVLGDQAPPRKQTKTIENMREKDETVVEADDAEVANDEKMDELSRYFCDGAKPKVIITSCYKPTKIMYSFIRDLLHVIPKSYYYPRRNYQLQEICKYANERKFTDVIVINEDHKKLNALTHVHLPEGPTAVYKLSSVMLREELDGRGGIDKVQPEVILNNFNTRLGHRVGRMLGTLFNQRPEFEGRRVVTFHNQRDFIFFRHHRYIFDHAEKARLQELGPRFTLKLKSLQKGTFASKTGEFEWVRKRELETSRKRFFL
jgi:ribosome production factor 1